MINEVIEMVRRDIQEVAAAARDLGPDIDNIQQVAVERLESLSESLHRARVRGVDRHKELMELYEDAGFSREEALVFLLDSRMLVKESIGRLSSPKSK